MRKKCIVLDILHGESGSVSDERITLRCDGQDKELDLYEEAKQLRSLPYPLNVAT